MVKTLNRDDTFLVDRAVPEQPKQDAAKPTRTVNLPGGQRIHTLSRSVFERAVRAAMQDGINEKK